MKKTILVACAIFFLNSFDCGGMELAGEYHHYAATKGISKIVKPNDIVDYMKIILQLSIESNDKEAIKLLSNGLLIIEKYSKNRRIYEQFSSFHNDILVLYFHPYMRKNKEIFIKKCTCGRKKFTISANLTGRVNILNLNQYKS